MSAPTETPEPPFREAAAAEIPSEGDHEIPPPRLDQVANILALTVRGALMDFAGGDDDSRLVIMAIFLRQLTLNPRQPEKMAGILRVVADNIEGAKA